MIASILNAAAAALNGHVESPRRDAEVLLAHLLGTERSMLVARAQDPVTASVQTAFEGLIARRRHGEPAAYLVGYRDFWTLRLKVDPHVLVPRPETELLVERALKHLSHTDTPSVLDLGTGSGAVGLAIASERPDARVLLVDKSDAALAIAEHNRGQHGLHNVTLRRSDWFAALGDARYHVIVSNPPYLGEDDPHLEDPALRHEPMLALVSGRSGLEALADICANARRHLVTGGALLLEHGATQGAAVRDLLTQTGFGEVTTHQDLAGLERATGGLRQD